MSWEPFTEIFNPGHRHFVEERNRKRIEAQKPGSEGNPLGVDLDKGVVHIQMPAASAPPDTGTDRAADHGAEDNPS